MADQQVILPQGLTAEKLSQWKSDNPTATEQDGIRAYINWRSKTEGKDPRQVLTEEYPQLGAVANPQNRLQQAPFEQTNAPVGHPWRTVDPGQGGTGKDVVNTLGDTALAASAGASAPASVGARLLQMAGRGATMGAGTSAVTGDNPVTGALSGGLTGALAQGAGEVIPAVGSIARRVWDLSRSSFATAGNQIKWAEQYAQDAFKGAAQEFPDTFIRVLNGAKSYTDGLYKLVQAAPGGPRNKMLGEQYLGDAIQRTERMAKTVLGGDDADVVVPTLRRALMDPKQAAQMADLTTSTSGSATAPALSPAGQAIQTLRQNGVTDPGRIRNYLVATLQSTPGEIARGFAEVNRGVTGPLNPQAGFNTPMTVKEAFDGLKTLTREAIDAGKSLESRSLWAAVDQAKTELLSRVPPKLAQEYVQDLSQYGKGLAFLNALKDGFGGKVTSPTKGVFDINGMLESLQTKGLSEYFPAFNDAVLKGAESGARETIKGGFRARVYKMGESGTVNVPGHRVEPLGGAPKAQGHSPSNLITGLSIPTLSENSRATDQTGSYTIE